MAQDLINTGTTANDRTGDTWRAAFGKANDNFTDLYTSGGLTNVTLINSAADFPAAVGGVRELVQTPGGAYTYIIGALEVDMGTETFSASGGQVVIIGAHRSRSIITTSSSGIMFDVNDCGFFPELFGVRCPNGQVVEFTNPSADANSLVLSNFIVFSCDSIGTVSGSFVCSLRTATIVSTTTSGLTFLGAANGQFNMSNTLGLDWAGSLIDLGTATFDLINIASSNRFISPVGTTIISGAASSANLNSGGRALVSSNIFNGTGTALSGITTEDLSWDFKDNVFADGVTHNTRNDVDAFLTATETVTIGSIGVYVAIGGTAWSSSIGERFTVSTAGLITYIGLDQLEIEIQATATVEKVGGGADKICTKIAIDTGSGLVVQDRTIGCTENSTATGVMSMGFFAVSPGDQIQLFVGNEDSNANIDVSESTILVKAI
jgi:hypothetical protein